MGQRLIYVLLWVLSAVGLSHAQELTITGIVKDSNGAPLLNASVVVKDTSHGVATNLDGKCLIKVPNNKTILVFSSLGAKTIERTVGANKVINATLQDEAQQLEGVMVTGYQELDRSKFTGNTQTPKADSVKVNGIVDVGRMIGGRTVGVDVQNISGASGTSLKITVRGGLSIFGDTKPLWVIDGAVREEVAPLTSEQLASNDTSILVSSAISGINANDIESIEILKDASALSLYGAHALNGVVIITTKGGRRDVRTRVNYQLEESVRMAPTYSQYDIMSFQETMDVYQGLEHKGYFSLSSHTQGRYRGVYNITYRAIDTYDPTTGKFLLENSDTAHAAFSRKYEYANTDWFETLFRPSLTQNHTVNLSGRGENTSIYGSISFFADPGWTIANRVHRATGNLKTSYILSPNVKVGILTQRSVRTQKAPGTFARPEDIVSGGHDHDFDINPLSYALSTSRTLRPYNDSSNLEYYRYNYARMNILDELANNYIDLNVTELKLQGDLKIKLTKGLKYNSLGSIRHVKSSSEHSITEDSNMSNALRTTGTTMVRQRNPFLFTDPNDPETIAKIVMPEGGIFKLSENSLQSYYFCNALRFKRLLKDVHDMKIFLGQEYRHTDRDNNSFTDCGYQFNHGGTIFTGYCAVQKAIDESNPYYSKSCTKERGIAFFSQDTYAYDNHYVLTSTLNYKGVNQLGRGHSARWLPTWNISGRWNASNGKFLENSSTISNLTLRTSYGLIAGLSPAGDALPVFRDAVVECYRGGDKESAIRISSLQDNEFTREKVYESNLGLELGLFKSRLTLSANIYQKNSKDLIDYVNTSGIGGQRIRLANNAPMVTKGIELTLDIKNTRTDNSGWSTSINFVYFNQEITRLSDEPSVYNLVCDLGRSVLRGARNTLYSYNFTSLSDKGMPLFNLLNGNTAYRDINFQPITNILSYLKKEGVVEPNVAGGLSDTFRYKSRELSALITVQANNKIRKAPQYSVDYNDLSVFPKEVRNRWVAAGDEQIINIPTIPSKRTITESGESTLRRVYNAYNYSSARIVDGSFARMKSINLSYIFDKEALDVLRVNSFSLHLQATDPFLICADKDLNGQDPEFLRSGGVTYPVTSQYTFTINLGI